MVQSSETMSTIVPTIKDNRLFAVDVHREVADKETWILLANDATNKVLIVMNIPKGTINGTNVRYVHDKYTLRFRASDYCTYKTSPYMNILFRK